MTFKRGAFSAKAVKIAKCGAVQKLLSYCAKAAAVLHVRCKHAPFSLTLQM